jgi:hypothetical protein
LSLGLISSGEEQPRFKCVCGEKLENQGMVPGNLERHLHTKHSHLCQKPIGYFKRRIDDQTRQVKQWTKSTTISGKIQEGSYAVAEIVVKNETNTVAQSVILPTCKYVNIMFGEEYKREIFKVLISHNTVSRRIQDMSQDVESQAMANIKEADFFYPVGRVN